MTLFEEFKRRGLIAQLTHEKEIEELFNSEKFSFYIGFDATADSLHVGHFLQLVVMKHMQNAGHKPVALLGTGTTMIGDPTGKTDMRKMLTVEEINHNADIFREQMSRFIDFSDGKAEIVKNGDWLLQMNYIDFLRDVGRYFSVNQMLTAECFKSRLENGLSFLEFNYMLMQSYDFLHLYRTKNVKMQLGGNDQWSNMLGGVDLVRRVCSGQAFAMTFTLLTTKEGKKMGKTEKGALWLDEEKCPVYDFYQYWRNVSDDDVINCLKLLTFLPIEQIEEMEQTLSGEKLNSAKEVLAYEVTALVHGKEKAEIAQSAAKAVFAGSGNSENMPTTTVSAGEHNILDLLVESNLAPSKGEARRLIQQGGISIDDVKITDIAHTVQITDFVIIKKGKKIFHKFLVF
ncbi:MAG: tyrosine--tRNA ligase [Oscillospiraceae bacterium]|jgi:tyrosyl-tRNA synthetase|nr:tyrosine--tRNA ligase [Oscillospiraceae bacterium]